MEDINEQIINLYISVQKECCKEIIYKLEKDKDIGKNEKTLILLLLKEYYKILNEDEKGD